MAEWSWILPDKLAQGSAPDGRVPFDVVVLCAEEWQPPRQRLAPAQVVRVPLDDRDPAVPGTYESARQAGEVVARFLRQRRNVLVTCAAGRNRSGLVSAYALHLYTGKPLERCARVVRLRRRNALTNRAFAAHLGA